MKKKLFVSDDSPAELKETISVCQQYIDNMQEFKVKADNGTLNFDDLEELTRRNNILVNQLPHNSNPRPGYPPQTSNLDELESYAKIRGEESAKLLKEEGGPVFKITTFDQLKEFSKMDPEAVGAIILAAAREKRGEAESTEEPEKETESHEMKIKKEFMNDLLIDNLNNIKTLLYNAKLCLFDLQYEWPKAETFEKQLTLRARTFKGYKQNGLELLTGILNEEEENEDLADKKDEAAFILASLVTDNSPELKELINLWREDEALQKTVIQAIKYSNNPSINDWILKNYSNESAKIKAGLIEVLDYRQIKDEKNWDKFLKQEDPLVSSKILRAYSLVGSTRNGGLIKKMMEETETDYFEEVVLSALISGEEYALNLIRGCIQKTPDKVGNLPLYLACSGDYFDFNFLKMTFSKEESRQSAIRALGIFGMMESVPFLIDAFSGTITNAEEWELQKCIVDSLNLITGANLPLPFPDIKEGPKGKEYDVTVEVSFKEQWAVWWYKNKHKYNDEIRYRRGNPFNIGSCVEEMAYPLGNHWSRQVSYYELLIRTGKYIAPFFADWYVKDQQSSIRIWKEWLVENRGTFRDKQWLFAGHR
ncbi:hypothetical protein KJ966_08835 [bacterium]|nr:hypothetical protein [bacterium]